MIKLHSYVHMFPIKLNYSKGSGLQKNCIGFFTSITIDSDTNTQAYTNFNHHILGFESNLKIVPKSLIHQSRFLPHLNSLHEACRWIFSKVIGGCQAARVAWNNRNSLGSLSGRKS